MKYMEMVDAINIVRKLQKNKFEAYFVGGCVRDIIMNKMPHDIDIATSAEPEEVQRIFNKTIPTGIKHGTITVFSKNGSYEVTTFRIDGNYSDGRHPNFVKYTSDIVEDLSRRDFTMNAIAYNPDMGEVIDPFDGKKDIQNKIIKCVGDANERFREDALRILRAIRFSAVLNFNIEQNTAKAMNDNKENLKNVSKERIREEIEKTLLSNHPEKIMQYPEILCEIIPEFRRTVSYNQKSKWHCFDLYNHMLFALKNAAEGRELDLYCRLALFLHDIGKPDAATVDDEGYQHYKGHGEISADIAFNILKRLRFDNATISIVVELIKYHDVTLGLTHKSVRRLLNKIGHEQFKRLMDIRICDILAQKIELAPDRIEKVKKLISLEQEIKESNDCLCLKDLAINGYDLMYLGYKGKEIGEVLKMMLDFVIENPTMNNRDSLFEYAKKLMILKK